MENRKGNAMVVGETGGGKTVALSLVTRCFLAKSDVNQIKALYSVEDGERMAEAIRQNCNIWYPLKPGSGHHDK